MTANTSFVRTGVLLLALFIVSCSGKKESSETDASSAEAAGRTPVSVVHPRVTTMTESVTFAATTSFLKKEIIRSTFTGFIRSVNATLGERVKAGSTLFRIATKEAAAAGEADSAAIFMNGAPLPAGAVSVKAAQGGVVTELNFHPGDYVTDGEQLAVVSDPSSMVVMVNVPFEEAAHVRAGASCTLLLPDGRRVAGVIARSLPALDEASQTQSFIIRAETALPSNLNLTVSIPVRQARSAIALPKAAVQSSETLDAFWVMKLIDDSTAVKCPVTTGIATDSTVQIVAPVFGEQDRIVLEHAYGLPDTARVSVVK